MKLTEVKSNFQVLLVPNYRDLYNKYMYSYICK